MSEAYIPTKQPQTSDEARVPSSDVDPGRAGSPEGPAPQGPGPAVRLIWRVERRELFVALRSARRGRSGPLTVAHVPGDPAEPPRVAFAVGRKLGGAVARNRVRRRLRALVRDPPVALAPGAYLIAAAPAAREAAYGQLGHDLRAALARATAGRVGS